MHIIVFSYTNSRWLKVILYLFYLTSCARPLNRSLFLRYVYIIVEIPVHSNTIEYYYTVEVHLS